MVRVRVRDWLGVGIGLQAKQAVGLDWAVHC